MTRQMLSLPRRQRGSFYSTMILVALFGLFLIAGLKIAPAYVDNNILVNAIEGVKANNDIAAMTITDLRSEVMRTLNTNRITFDAGNIVVVREDGRDYIDVNYDTRVHLFYNIDALVSFENRFEKF